MKRKNIIFVIIFCSLLISSCKDLKEESKIAFYCKDDDISIKEGTFIIDNKSNDTYFFGPEYIIEAKENNQWKELKLDYPLSWNSVIYKLIPGDKIEFKIDFELSYGILASGEYRIIKKINNQNNGASQDIFAYFTIKNKEVLPIMDLSNLNLELNDLTPEIKEINIEGNNILEREKSYYQNDSDLKVLTDYINEYLNISIDKNWKVIVHYFDLNKSVGMIEFIYTIGEIETNKSIVFNIDNKKINRVYYHSLNLEVDEQSLINRLNKFKANYEQEKMKLVDDQKFISEETNYIYYYDLDKLLYEYVVYFSYGDHEVINNDYGTVCIIDENAKAIIIE